MRVCDVGVVEQKERSVPRKRSEGVTVSSFRRSRLERKPDSPRGLSRSRSLCCTYKRQARPMILKRKEKKGKRGGGRRKREKWRASPDVTTTAYSFSSTRSRQLLFFTTRTRSPTRRRPPNEDEGMALTPKQGEYFCGRRPFSDSSWARKEKENLQDLHRRGPPGGPWSEACIKQSSLCSQKWLLHPVRMMVAV